MSAPAVGIDLGTTNSVVAVSIGGRPQVLIDSNTGSTLIPSVVSFPESGERVVGRAARLCRAQDPKNTVYSVKRLLGRPYKSEEVRRARSRVAFDLKEGPDSSVLVGTRAGEMSLPELSAYVLREVRRVAEAALRDKVEKCVVTVPANFNELQRSSTKVAGRIAELEVVRILNEPTAAALAYGYGRGTREKICIFDFGGGTFDVTLLELSGNVFEVLATAGDTFLGGDDIDIAITDSLVVPFQRATKIDPLQDRVVYDVLRDAAETAKCQLSTQDNTRVSLEYAPAGAAPLRFQQQLSRADLERLAAPFISRTFDVCSDALKLAGLRPTDLTSVILVGGSTRIPSVRQRVASFFSRDPLTNLPPEEVVAMGASILAEALTGGARRAPSTKSMNERASTIPPQQAPLPPSHSRPPAAGLPGAPGAPPRQTLSGVNPDNSTPGARMDSVSGAKLVGEETMITDSPLVPPTSGEGHSTKRFGPVDLDDPFAAPSAPRKAPPPPGEARAVGRTLELDEPSFMGRIRKQGVEDATREHSVPAFNLDDPSVVAPMPTSVRAPSPAKGPTLTEESYAKLPPSIAAAITPPPPRLTEHSVPSFQLDEAVLIGGDSASSPGARVREVSVPSFKIDTDDIFGAGGAEATMIGEAPSIPGFDAAEAATFRPNAREPSMPGARLPEEPTRIIPPAAAPKDDPTTVFPTMPPPAAPAAPTLNAQGVVVPPPLSAGARAPFAPPPSPAAAPVVPPSAFPPASTAVAAVALGGVASTLIAEPPRGLGSVFPPSSPTTNQQSVSKSLPNAPLLLDVTPFSLGVETAGGQCEPVIRRNATIPVEQTRIFATTSDGQVAVVIRISQGESRRFVDNQNLGELELSGLRAAPRGEVQVAVTFELEADGTLRVRARDNESGRETQTRVTLLTLPSESAQAEAAARARGASVVAPMPS